MKHALEPPSLRIYTAYKTNKWNWEDNWVEDELVMSQPEVKRIPRAVWWIQQQISVCFARCSQSEEAVLGAVVHILISPLLQMLDGHVPLMFWLTLFTWCRAILFWAMCKLWQLVTAPWNHLNDTLHNSILIKTSCPKTTGGVIYLNTPCHPALSDSGIDSSAPSSDLDKILILKRNLHSEAELGSIPISDTL